MASVPVTDYTVICDRCRRPAHHLESWLERRRLRLPSPALGGHTYSHRIVEHLVCRGCYAEVRAGRPVGVHNGYRIMAAAVLGAALMAASLPVVMPDLLSAFWSSAPTSWREPHLKGRSEVIQGRY